MRCFPSLPALALLAVGAYGQEPEVSPSVRLTLKRGTESVVLKTFLPLGRSYNTVVASSGATPSTLIVNLLAVGTPDGGRLSLMYQVEWSLPTGVLQAQDSAELSDREDVLLTDVAGEWSLRALAEDPSGDSCAAPGSGGGLLVRVRARHGDHDHTVTRRTEPGMKSGLLAVDFPERPGGPSSWVTLTPSLSDDGAAASVEYDVELDTRPSLDPDRPARKASIPLGTSTLVEGDGKPDGVWIAVDTIPVVSAAVAAVPEVPDPKTGWLRHAGPNLSFLHPPGWKVRRNCGPDLVPQGWSLGDPESRDASRVGAFFVPGENPPLKTRSAGMGVSSGETVKVQGGTCFLGRSPDDPRAGHASCDSAAGERLELMLIAGSEKASRYDDFSRVVRSLAFKRRPALAP